MRNSFRFRLKHFFKNINKKKILEEENKRLKYSLSRETDISHELRIELEDIRNIEALKEFEKRQEHKKKVDPYLVDHYRVVYDKDSELTKVSFNDNQIHGCMNVEVEVDPDTQMTTLSLKVFGDIKVEQGKVKDFEKEI